MAYLRDLDLHCQYGGHACVKPARKELFNRQNGSCGIFCAQHAKVRLKALESIEDEWNSSDRAASKPPA